MGLEAEDNVRRRTSVEDEVSMLWWDFVVTLAQIEVALQGSLSLSLSLSFSKWQNT